MAYRSAQSKTANRRSNDQKKTAKGLCIQCGKRPVRARITDGLPAKQCQPCYEIHLRPGRWATLRAKRVREAKIALGICSQSGCDSEAIPGRSLCDFHRELVQEACAAGRKARRAAGLCSICGDPPEPGFAKCRRCLDNYARYQQKHKRKRRVVALEVAKPMKKTG